MGLLDADLYGPSMGMMFGITEGPEGTPEGKIVPIEKFGIKLMSIAFLIEEDRPVIWRGPMLNKALTQFLGDVLWGELDYLFIDLPPGTGDTQISLIQNARVEGAIIVSTPQDVAFLDARKAIGLFQTVKVPIAGVIENMSSFHCPSCHTETAIFGHGTVGKVILWGVDGGILATLAVGIPYILTFYFILALIEDTGYMNAAAFLSDRIMHKVGLHGRAIIPLIAAGGCNVPAIIATRSLSSKRERTIAAVLATLTPCSARTAVIIGAVAGVAGWQYAVFTYLVIIVVIIVSGLVMNRLMPGDKGVLVMEMFPFRRPVLRQVVRKTWRRFREFVWDAAPIILLGSMALGLLYETGWVWHLGTILKPVVEGWLLLPMVAGLTLVFAILRKELALQLLLVFAAVQAGGAVVGISSFMTTSQIVTYALVNAIYVPCVATIAVLGRELGWRRTVVICASTIGIALLVGGVVARVLPLFA